MRVRARVDDLGDLDAVLCMKLLRREWSAWSWYGERVGPSQAWSAGGG